MLLINEIKQKIQNKKKDLLYRKRKVITHRYGKDIVIENNRLVNFASNDYLGLANHPKVKTAFIEGIRQYGIGGGSSAFVSGYYHPHAMLEEKLAEFFQRDKAIIFNSGYLANIGVMTTLANRHSTILSDKLIHASILDGITLSQAKHYRYPHNNLSRLEEIIFSAQQPTLIVTEGVFSMEGDISPVDKISALALKNKSTLIIDDAHGVGVLGSNGKGICEYFNLNQQHVPCLITPFGKSFGSLGAAVLGKEELIEGITQFAKTYCYTTALPPAICLATLESLKVLQVENWRREKLQSLINFFITAASERKLLLASVDLTPIKSIVIGDNKTALKLQNFLILKGFYTACVRPPTVPKKTARIRVSLNCLHEEDEIIQLLDLVASFYAKNE